MLIEENIGEKLNDILDILISKKPFLNIEEASVLTGFNISYLRQLNYANKITAYKPLGKHLYFRTSDLLLLNNRSDNELIELRKFKSTTLINNEFSKLNLEVKSKLIMTIYYLNEKLKS